MNKQILISCAQWNVSINMHIDDIDDYNITIHFLII